jgi:hypothetical protein
VVNKKQPIKADRKKSKNELTSKKPVWNFDVELKEEEQL